MKLTKRTDLQGQFHATYLPVPLDLDSVGGKMQNIRRQSAGFGEPGNVSSVRAE